MTSGVRPELLKLIFDVICLRNVHVIGRNGLSNLSTGTEHMKMIFTVAGLIGFLIVTVLSVSASKAIMTYYERLRLKVFYQ